MATQARHFGNSEILFSDATLKKLDTFLRAN